MTSALASDVCRVTVQADDRRIDVALPANIAVAELLPMLVEVVGGTDWQAAPTVWELAHIDGRQLSAMRSLRGNDVRDGDLLLLNRARTASAPPCSDDVIADISTSLDTPQWSPTAARVVASAVSIFSSALTVFPLMRGEAQTSALIAWALSALALVGVVVHERVYAQSLTVLAIGVAAVLWAAVGGYRTVPGEAAAPKLLLAAASGATASVLAGRCTSRGTAFFAAVASAGFIAMTGAGTALFVPTRVSAAGAVIVATAAGVLIIAARLAISVSRLPIPRLPGSPEGHDDETGVSHFLTLGRRAHAITTGLVCGASAAGAAGAGVCAYTGQFSGALLAAVIGLVLITRAGTHVDLTQMCALIAGGVACFGVLFVRTVQVHPTHAHWIALGAAGISVAALALAGPRPPASPLRRRGMELIEYAALAAVAPLACWTFGVFGAARGLA